MPEKSFDNFFTSLALDHLTSSIDKALEEDGEDLTSRALFDDSEEMEVQIVGKEKALIAGLPLIDLILFRSGSDKEKYQYTPHIKEGEEVEPNTKVASIEGSALTLLKSERTILNFLSHLSGIATLTNEFVRRMQTSKSKITDTRKTLPGLRFPEKYAVKVGGGHNHRFNLQDMLMLKDNHIDRAGGISKAVGKIREKYNPCPPIEIECRSRDDVQEAVNCGVDRIMLDNMSISDIKTMLDKIPPQIETEISGGVSLHNIHELSSLGADFISCGFLTHSASSIDLSMQSL